MINAFPSTIGRSGLLHPSYQRSVKKGSRVLLYDGSRAAVVVRWSPEEQIWRKLIEVVEVMGPDELIAGSGSG